MVKHVRHGLKKANYLFVYFHTVFVMKSKMFESLEIQIIFISIYFYLLSTAWDGFDLVTELSKRTRNCLREV